MTPAFSSDRAISLNVSEKDVSGTNTQIMRAYMVSMRANIQNIWKLKQLSSNISDPVALQFEVTSNGEFHSISILQTSKNADFDQAAIDAIKNMTPAPLPEGLKILHVKAKFNPVDKPAIEKNIPADDSAGGNRTNQGSESLDAANVQPTGAAPEQLKPTSTSAEPSLAVSSPNPQGQPHLFQWTKDAPNCTRFLRDGRDYRAIVANNIGVSYCLTVSGKHIISNIHIMNNSNRPVDVIPEQFLLNGNAPLKSSTVAKNQARTAKTLAFVSKGTYTEGQGYQPPLRSRTTIDGNMTTSGPLTNFSGTGSTTYSRRPSLVGLLASHAAKEADETQALSRSALQANTLFPGQQIAGTLVFAKQKEVTSKLSATINDDTFEFPE
jgi:TonB family protein